MNDQRKTKDELIKELQDLKQAQCLLKESYDQEINLLQLEIELLQNKSISMDAVFDSSPAAMLIIDETTNIMMVNLAAKKLCGSDEAEILQHRAGNALHCIHSSKDPRGCGYSKDCKFCEIRNGVEALIANGGSIHGAEFKLELIRNGKPESVWMNVGMTPLLLEGKKHWCIALDEITKRKKTEASLQESQLLLKSSIESLNDTLVFSINKEYKYLYFNKLHQYVMLNSYGCNINLAMNMLDCLTNEEDQSQWKNNFDRALKGESHITIEEYGVIDRYSYETRYNPIFNDQNEIIGATAFSVNITERKQAQEALRVSEERFRNLLQSIPSVSVQGYSSDGTIQYWNQASEHLYGYSAQEAIGKNILDMIIPPEMRNDVTLAIQQMFETGQPLPSSELSLMRKDGSLVSVFSSHTIVESPGKPKELFCIDIDLSERIQAENALKESEELNRLLFENSGEAILFTEPDGKICYANNEASRIFGRSKTEMIGLGRSEIVDPNDSRLADALEERKRTGKFKGELNMVRNDGTIFPVEVSSTIFKDSKGNDRTSLIIIDITERKKAEMKLKENQVHLNELIANKDKFFSIIAHDLRNPFNSFLGLTQLMAEELPSLEMSQVQEIAFSMSKSATNLYRLLENLLQWSQIQQGAMPFNPQMVQLALVIQESIEMVQNTAEKKGIEIVSQVPVPMPIFVDVNMLQSVIRNLISNAVKYSNKGGNIFLSARPTADNKIEIAVKDSGIGISQTMIDNLFRIDVKNNRKGTDGELSTGLGLLLCNQFIKKHKGNLWVESEVEKGSTFYFNLPLKFELE